MTNLATVTITNPFSRAEQNFQTFEQEAIDLAHLPQRERPGFFAASFYPIRTNSLKNIAKDCLLPATTHLAMRVDCHVIGKLIAIIAAAAWDLATLPIRLLSLIPRIIYNAMQPEHEIIAILERRGIARDFSPEIIQIRTSCPYDQRLLTGTRITNEGRERLETYCIRSGVIERTVTINLIAVPRYSSDGELTQVATARNLETLESTETIPVVLSGEAS